MALVDQCFVFVNHGKRSEYGEYDLSPFAVIPVPCTARTQVYIIWGMAGNGMRRYGTLCNGTVQYGMRGVIKIQRRSAVAKEVL